MPSGWKKVRKGVKKRLGLRTERPPFTGKYYDRARCMLLDVVDIFNQAGLPYSVDAGTLLGLVRDGDLIPWDNDLDIMLPVEAIPQLHALYDRIKGKGWRVSHTYTMPFACEAWQEDNPRVIKIRSQTLLHIGAGSTLLDITIIYRHDDHYWWEMSNRICRIPAEFLDRHQTIAYAGRQMRVPYDYERYLQHTYGDWRTPQQAFPRDEFGIILRKP
ncbi:MAG: LicD family protein [Candidatus Thiodiazotropha sp. (ex Troendleina suluensis)]|nr:LicD family protein [Candidatus Thiodiazotropha sp. (ex Troendleina suluensis)]